MEWGSFLKDSKTQSDTNKPKNTVESIARLAGVSRGTVSNALNNRKGVSEAKRQEIIQIARSLEYDFNPPRRTENALRFVIAKRHGAVVDDTPFFSVLIKGIESKSRDFGCDLLISHLNIDDISHGAVNELCEPCKGMVILATEMLAQDMAWFSAANIPIVLLDNYFHASPYDCVLINNAQGIRLATEHLLEMGHRNIGLLDASQYINNFVFRRESFHLTMRMNGLQVKTEIPITPTADGAYSDMKLWLEGGAPLPSAFVAENDIIAFGAMRAMSERGISIPGDVSIIGFDDVPFCNLSTPRLTTIGVNKFALGQIAVRTLVEQLDAPNDTKVKVETGVELIPRESVMRLDAAPIIL